MGSGPLRRRAVGLVFLAAACDAGTAPPVEPDPVETSPVAAAYLEEVVGVMQGNSVRRLDIDWPAFREDVFATAQGAQTIGDTYPAIHRALELLADGHSGYRGADGTVLFVPTRSCGAAPVQAPDLPADIGYVRVPAFSGTAAQATAYAQGLHDAIAAADSHDLAGWIVDVRGNTGGNMWPMIAGLGPILGEDTIGFFADPAGVEQPWLYRDGASWIGESLIQAVPAPYTLLRPAPRVAVLLDNMVMSSGEAVAIGFRGRPDTRQFGTATCGLATANARFDLSDGGMLNLTVAAMADRERREYPDGVAPDEVAGSPQGAVIRATDWLRS